MPRHYTLNREDDYTEQVGSEIISKNLENKMNNGLFKLTKENLYSALVYGVLAVALVVIAHGSIFGLDWKVLVDTGVLAVLASLVKNLLTTEKGNFAGVVKVIPENK